MTEQRTIPPKPTDRTANGWALWVHELYPFDPEWEAWIRTRGESERPVFGTPESLDDLRGVRDRGLAAMFAWSWWATFENTKRVLKVHAAQKRVEQQVERKRLMKLCLEALDGHLGQSREDRDNAQATAQKMIGHDPERCSDDDLSDWWLMHNYAKRVARWPNAPRPKLARDVRAEEAQRRSLRDIEGAIDAIPAAKPRAVRQGETWGQ